MNRNSIVLFKSSIIMQKAVTCSSSLSIKVFIFILIASFCKTDNVVCDYDLYLQNFNRNFVQGSPQYNIRKANFQINCTKITQLNLDPTVTSAHAVNQFTDYGLAELTGMLGNYFSSEQMVSASDSGQSAFAELKVAALVPPTELDYKALGKVTSVKNQGQCGCCWSFAGISMYESLLLFNNFPQFDLSEEETLECTTNYASNGRVSDCGGGYLIDTLTKLNQVGAVLESKFPYVASTTHSGLPGTSEICSEQNRIKVGDGVPAYSSTLTQLQIQSFLATNGPVMVGIYANAGLFSYSSGVYSGCPSNAASFINHAVELYGYDSNGNWLLKNQWGTSWGQSGFLRLSSALDCGISRAIYGIQVTQVYSSPNVTVTSPTLKTSPSTGGSNSSNTNNSNTNLNYLIASSIFVTFLLLN